ncbi:MAG TPA: hypothetical protein VJ697_03300 [Nitrososphaeraceae archaeon]|nr:hypothetical protein [Nitrososphaeraceae archaeon]
MTDNERNQYVIHCIVKRFSDKEALVYLKSMGYKMSSVTYWRIRKSILGNRFKRIQEIADHELREK